MSDDPETEEWMRDEITELRSEIARLRDELQSATRHMELAEAAWLRETAGNSPVAVALTPEEREAVEIAVEYVGSAYQVEHYADVLRGLLERTR